MVRLRIAIKINVDEMRCFYYGFRWLGIKILTRNNALQFSRNIIKSTAISVASQMELNFIIEMEFIIKSKISQKSDMLEGTRIIQVIMRFTITIEASSSRTSSGSIAFDTKLVSDT